MKDYASVFYLFLAVTVTLSCNRPVKSDTVSINQITTNYDTLINRVRTRGNQEAYSEIFYGCVDGYFENGMTDTVMYYSNIMAVKYHYEGAFYDYLTAILLKYEVKWDSGEYDKLNLTSLDSEKKLKVLDWLKIMKRKRLISQKEFDSIRK